MQIQTWQIKVLDFVQDVLIDLDKSQHHNEKKTLSFRRTMLRSSRALNRKLPSFCMTRWR